MLEEIVEEKVEYLLEPVSEEKNCKKKRGRVSCVFYL